MEESPPLGDGDDVCFGIFRLQRNHGRLRCGEQEVALQPKAWEVLCYLAARPGALISIDELLDNCWRGLHVGPQVVNNVIYKLRAVFRSGGGDAAWIQSVARRGYRFNPPLHSAVSPASDSEPGLVVAHDPSPPDPRGLFVGRQWELALIEKAWHQSKCGSTSIVFVAGEPGIGKTTLVEHFLNGLAATSPNPLAANAVTPFLLARAQCVEQSGPCEPYMAALEALGSLASTAPVTEVAREHASTWLIQMPWLLPKEERAALRQSLAGVGPAACPRAPRLATHFAAANDLEREFEYCKLSVQLAAGRYAHRETLGYIDRTIEVLARLPATDERRTTMLGWQVERGNQIMDWQGYAAGFETFTRAAEMAHQQGNALLEFIGHAGRCMSGLMGRSHRAEARNSIEILRRIAAEGNPELTALAEVLAGCVSDSFGDPARGLAHAEAALAALPHALLGLPRGFDIETVIHVLLVTVLTRLGMSQRVDHERGLVMQGVEKRAGLAGQAHACAFLACDALIAAQPELAIGYAKRSIAAAREGGFRYFEIAAEAALEVATSMLARDGAIDGAGLERLTALIEERRGLDESWYNMLFAAYLADAHRRRGDLDLARAGIDAAFEEAEDVYLPELWRIKGEIELASAPTGTAAASCFQTAIDLARAQGTRLFELRSTIALTRLRAGADGTRQALATLYESFQDAADTPDRRDAAHLLDELATSH